MRAALSLTALALACGGSTPAPSAAGNAPAPRAEGSGIFASGEAVGYRIEDKSGKPIGRTHSVFTSAEGRLSVVTRVERVIDGATVSVEHATTVRADLSPVRYKRLSTLKGRYELEFADDSVRVILDADGHVLTNRVVKTPVVAADDPMMLALALGDLKLAAGGEGVLDLFAPEDLSKEHWKVQASAEPGGVLLLSLPGGRVRLGPSRVIETAELGDRRFVRLPEPGKPPEVKYSQQQGYVRLRGNFRDVPLTIPVAGGQLAGELSLPDGVERPPCVLLLSDRGEHDRLGRADGIDSGLLELADALADRGFAVARLDDRGAGASSSQIDRADRGLELYVGDAQAAYAALAGRAELDPARIFVLGHGLGGVLAIELASRVKVAGLLLAGTPFRSARERLAAEEARLAKIDALEADRRARNLLAALGGDPAALAAVDPERVRAYRADRALTIDLGKLELASVIAKVTAPVAIFQGIKDFEVLWREDADPLLKAFEKALGKGKVKLHAYDHTDHLMKAEPKTSSLERYADASRRLEPRYVSDVLAWLSAEAKRAP